VTSQSITVGRLFTVVVASRCDDARSELLKRACDSVRAMAADLDYSIIVVANGPRVSQSVLDWLATRPDVRVIRLRTGSYPLARRIGAEMADSEFLAFLDDDDELFPNTLERKVAFFREHPDIDVLVTDGVRVSGTTESMIFPPPELRDADLVKTMMHAGWSACSMTLRARNIDLSAFDAEFRHLEWTYAALQLARRYRFGYLDEPTYRYYEGTLNSLWKDADHCSAALDVWRRLSKTYAGTAYESTVRRRFGHACHIASWEFVGRGRVRDAWRLHIMSLSAPGGLAALPYSAKLLFASARGRFGAGVSGLDNSHVNPKQPNGGPAN